MKMTHFVYVFVDVKISQAMTMMTRDFLICGVQISYIDNIVTGAI